VPAILDAGYNFDFIDSAAIDRVGIHLRGSGDPEYRAPAAGNLAQDSPTTREAAGWCLQHKVCLRARRDFWNLRGIPPPFENSHANFSPGCEERKLVANTSDLGAAIAGFLKPECGD